MTRRNLKAEEIKRKVKIEEILERYGYELNRAGFISCPFHNEKTPSLKIYPETNSYYCFGCNTGGDVISFVMHLLRIDFGSAILRLDNDFCLRLISRIPRGKENAPGRRTEKAQRTGKKRSDACDVPYTLPDDDVLLPKIMEGLPHSTPGFRRRAVKPGIYSGTCIGLNHLNNGWMNFILLKNGGRCMDN